MANGGWWVPALATRCHHILARSRQLRGESESEPERRLRPPPPQSGEGRDSGLEEAGGVHSSHRGSGMDSTWDRWVVAMLLWGEGDGGMEGRRDGPAWHWQHEKVWVVVGFERPWDFQVKMSTKY